MRAEFPPFALPYGSVTEREEAETGKAKNRIPGNGHHVICRWAGIVIVFCTQRKIWIVNIARGLIVAVENGAAEAV